MNDVMFAVSQGGSGSSAIPAVLLLLLALITWIVVVGGVVFLVVWLIRRGKAKASPGSPLQPPLPQKPPPSTCPRCGSVLPADSPQGLCPRCVMGVGLATQTEATGEFGPHGTKVVKPPPSPADIAKNFPHLEILDCLGRGGMGVVYKARQPKLNRLVALKILAPEKGADPKFAERFLREAQALARLSHPNIVTVHDFGEADGMFYLLMEYVDGATLRQLLREGRMKPETALTIVPRICEALQFAHEQGVVHRDIKPENVLLDKQGRVKIADFGIAKIVAGTEQPLTRPADTLSPSDGERAGVRSEVRLTQDQVLGTPHYMAPEQVEHPLTVDHRADIYSLGVVFYEMLTGELPLGKFQPPSKKVQVDVRLDEVVLHALEKEPERRYQHVSEVKSDVETIATSPSPGSSRREEAQAGKATTVLNAIVVGTRNGERVINWPGVIQAWLLLSIIIGFVFFGGCRLLGMQLSFWASAAYGLVCGATVVGSGVMRGWSFPKDKLASLDGAAPARPSATAPSVNESALAKARREVKNPASWLVATGILNWIAIPFIVMMILPFASRKGVASTPAVFALIAALFLSSAMILAGLKMKRLEAYSLAVMGSFLAIFITPGNIIGLPVGIWCLVTLFRRDVREAFAKARLLPPDTAHPKLGRAWKTVIAIAVTMMILLVALFGFLGSLRMEVNRDTVASPAGIVSKLLGRKLRNPVQLDGQGQPIATHVMQIWSQDPSRPDAVTFTLEGRMHTELDKVVARIGELMRQKPFPYIRVHIGPPAWGRAEGQKFIEELVARCRKIGFINLSFQYDLMEAPDAKVPADATFGPVIERVVNDDGTGRDFFIDLDSGKLFTPPKGLNPSNTNKFAAWLRETGVDAMGETSVSIHGLVGMEMVARPVVESYWDNLTVQDALANDVLQHGTPGAPAFLSAKGRLPEPFLFRTREGGVGLLQITGFTDNPRGVKIRYKLVQTR